MNATMTQPISKRDAVRILIEEVPQAAQDNRLLVLLYWKVVEGIPITDDMIQQVLARGTSPESLTRLARFALADLKASDNQ